MTSSVRISAKVEVTPEMIEAGQLAYEMANEYPYDPAALAAAYRAMRALEPGPADPGVTRQARMQ